MRQLIGLHFGVHGQGNYRSAKLFGNREGPFGVARIEIGFLHMKRYRIINHRRYIMGFEILFQCITLNSLNLKRILMKHMR